MKTLPQVNFPKFLGSPFHRGPPGDCFWGNPNTLCVILLSKYKQDANLFKNTKVKNMFSM